MFNLRNFYESNILKNSLTVQQNIQAQSSYTKFINIKPEQITKGSVFDISLSANNLAYKYISFNENILMTTSDNLSRLISFNKYYTMKEFLELTGIIIFVTIDGKKLEDLKVSISVQSVMNIIVRLEDNSLSDNYVFMISKIVSKYQLYYNPKNLTISMNSSEWKNTVFFVDGELTYIHSIIDNSIATCTLPNGSIVEKYTFKNVYFNGLKTSINIGGYNCIEFDENLNTVIDPNLILFSNQSIIPYKFYNTATPVGNRLFKVSNAGTYYVVAFHDPSIGSKVINSVAKYESVFGTIHSINCSHNVKITIMPNDVNAGTKFSLDRIELYKTDQNNNDYLYKTFNNNDAAIYKSSDSWIYTYDNNFTNGINAINSLSGDYISFNAMCSGFMLYVSTQLYGAKLKIQIDNNTPIYVNTNNATTNYNICIANIKNISGNASNADNPISQYEIYDTLRELIDLPANETEMETKHAFEYFPDLYKNILESKYSFEINSNINTNYPLYNNNYHIYASGPERITFSEPCREFVFPDGYGAPMLFFDGLSLAIDYFYKINGRIHIFIKDSRIIGKKICIVYVGDAAKEANSYIIKVDENMKATLPPNPKMGTQWNNFIVVDENFLSHSYKIIDCKIDIVDDITTFTFNDAFHIGRRYKVYRCDVGYYEFFKSKKTMSFELPWYLMYSHDSIFAFIDNRLLQSCNVMPPVAQRIINNKVLMGLNYSSDITYGQDVVVMCAPEIELYESKKSMDPTPIYRLSRKEYPFSKKYMLVFINGRFIHPDDIIEISDYVIGIRGVTSLYNITIYKYKFNDDVLPLFKQSTGGYWRNKIDTMSNDDLANKLNLPAVSDVESHFGEALDNQSLWDILYDFILSDCNKEATEQSVLDLAADFSLITNEDGRIILDGNRGNSPPRYIY